MEIIKNGDCIDCPLHLNTICVVKEYDASKCQNCPLTKDNR